MRASRSARSLAAGEGAAASVGGRRDDQCGDTATHPVPVRRRPVPPMRDHGARQAVSDGIRQLAYGMGIASERTGATQCCGNLGDFDGIHAASWYQVIPIFRLTWRRTQCQAETDIAVAAVKG